MNNILCCLKFRAEYWGAQLWQTPRSAVLATVAKPILLSPNILAPSPNLSPFAKVRQRCGLKGFAKVFGNRSPKGLAKLCLMSIIVSNWFAKAVCHSSFDTLAKRWLLRTFAKPRLPSPNLPSFAKLRQTCLAPGSSKRGSVIAGSLNTAALLIDNNNNV